MSIIFFIVFGFIVGLLARAILPGRQHMGWLMTTVLGVAGSFLGGAIGSLITGNRFDTFHSAGIIGSVIGAIILLAVASPFLRTRHLVT